MPRHTSDYEVVYEDEDVQDEDDQSYSEQEDDQEQSSDQRLYSQSNDDEDDAKDSYRPDPVVERLRESNLRLEQRIAAQEWREHVAKKQAIENEYSQTVRAGELAEQRLAQAVAEANGDDAAYAIKLRDEVRVRKIELENQYQQYQNLERQAANAPKPLDPRVVDHAQEWMKKHKWYDQFGRNSDSKKVLQIDQQLVNEGYVPHTAQYWKELDRRVVKKLPHRFKESAPARKSNTIYISPERKEALILAGVWDDPQLRMKYALQYQQWDRENGMNN